MSWLKDRLEEAAAQVNPFDKGKTASTVRQQRQRTPPAQTVRRKPQPDNQPGFQLTNNSVTRGLSRSFDQLNPLDNGRTWKQRTPTNAESLIHQATHNGATNMVGNGVVKPLIRSSMALNQGIGNAEVGIAHKLGLAKNVQTQNAQQYAANTGIKNIQRNTGYTGTKQQIIGDLVTNTANIAVPGTSKVVKGAFNSVAPKVVPRVINRAVANAGVGAAGGAVNNLGAEMGNNNIHSANDLIKAARTGAQYGAVLGVGGTLAAPVVKAGARQVVSNTPKLVRATNEVARKADSKLLTPRTTANDQLTLQDLSNHYAGTRTLKPAELSQTIAKAREIGQKHGVDITSGSQLDRMNAVNSILDKVKTENRAISEGGYVRLPSDAPDDLVKKVFQKGTDGDALYHGTKYDNALNILKSGGIKANKPNSNRQLKYEPGKSQVSLSRQRNSGFYNSPSADVKFVVDKSKIGKTKGYVDGDLKPSDYTNPSAFEAESQLNKDIPLQALKRVEGGPLLEPKDEAELRKLAQQYNIPFVGFNDVKGMRSVIPAREKVPGKSPQQAPKGKPGQLKGSNTRGTSSKDQLAPKNQVAPLAPELEGSHISAGGKTGELPPNSATLDTGLPQPIQRIDSQDQLLQQKRQAATIGQELKSELPLESKIQQKPEIVNEGKRAIDGKRDTFGLVDSFQESDKVPADLKQALGAFGNERTVRNNKELWSKAQQRVSEDPVSAYKYFTENSNDDGVATGYALINRFMRSGQTKDAGDVAMTMAERALESGRTTQAYALMKRMTPEGSVQYVENKVAKYSRQFPDRAKKLKWNDDVRSSLYGMADELNKLPEGRDRNLLISKMQETIDNIFPSSKKDKAITVWKAGLLTSLRTHERNILSNGINLAAEQLANIPGSLADRLMAVRTGERKLVATSRGLAHGAREGSQLAKDQVMTGLDPTQSNLKMNLNHVTWGDNRFEKFLKGATEAVYRPLGAEDKIFREAARSNSFVNQALAEAKNKKLAGSEFERFIEDRVNNPTAAMRDVAEQDAGRATFTHDNFLGDIISNAKRSVRNSNKRGAGTASAALDVLMPFTQVPSGVASQLYAYSPAKFAKSLIDVTKVLATGNKDIQREVSQGFGRSAVGTALVVGGGYLFNKGLMTGQPRDDAERAQWEAEGKQPNSVKVGGRWVPLTSIGPQSLLQISGAQLASDRKNGDNAALNFTANAAKNFKDQTFLKGMSSALDAVDDPKRYAQSYAENQVASVVPNIVKDFARATDSNERNPIGIADKLKSSVPGLSHSVPKKLDSYGEEKKNAGIGELLDLFNTSKEKDIPEAKYLDALRDVTGLKDHIPNKVDKTIQVNGKSMKLNSDQYNKYQKYVGGKTKELVSGLVNDPEFNSLPDEDKVKQIDDAIQGINSAAKVELFGNDPKNMSKQAKAVLSGGKASVYSSKFKDDPLAAKFDLKASSLSDKDKKKWLTEAPDDTAQKLIDRASKIRPEGFPDLPKNNATAEAYTKLLAKRADGLSKLKENEAKKDFLKTAYSSSYDSDTQDIRGLSQKETLDALDQGLITKDQLDKAVEMDNVLDELGLSTANISKSLRQKLGYNYAGSQVGKGRSASGSGGKKSSKKISFEELLSTPNQVNKSLRQLVEDAQISHKASKIHA